MTLHELDSHLTLCSDCRRWREAAHEVTRRARLAAARPVPGAPPELIALASGVPELRRASRDLLWTRVALAVVGTAQLAWVAVPALLLGSDRDAPIHVSHEMGSFDMAVAVGLLLAAWLPSRAQGMRVLVGAAALLLALTAIVDLASASTTVGDEAPHLLVLAGWLLLRQLAKLDPAGGGEQSFTTAALHVNQRRAAGLLDERHGRGPLAGVDRRRENVAA